MFPLGMLLLLMSGNAPAPAVRLSIKPMPVQIPKSLNRPQLPHCHEAPIHLKMAGEMAGKKYCPNTSSSLGKNVIIIKKSPNFPYFLLNNFLPLKDAVPRQVSSLKKSTCPAPGYTTHAFLQTGLWWCLSELVPQGRNNLGFWSSGGKSDCLYLFLCRMRSSIIQG